MHKANPSPLLSTPWSCPLRPILEGPSQSDFLCKNRPRDLPRTCLCWAHHLPVLGSCLAMFSFLPQAASLEPPVGSQHGLYLPAGDGQLQAVGEALFLVALHEAGQIWERLRLVHVKLPLGAPPDLVVSHHGVMPDCETRERQDEHSVQSSHSRQGRLPIAVTDSKPRGTSGSSRTYHLWQHLHCCRGLG